MSESKQMLYRSEIPVDQTWDLTTIYPNLETWNSAFQQVIDTLSGIDEFRGRLGEGADTLLGYLKTAETLSRLATKVYAYAVLDSAVDTMDQPAMARAGQARSLVVQVASALAFADPELMVIGFDRLREWMQLDPRLRIYAHYFERLEDRQPHVREGQVEEILASASDPLGNPMVTYRMLTDADMRFAPAVGEDGVETEVGQSTITGLLNGTDRQARQSAWENYADGYLGLKNTLASTLTGIVKRDVFNMRARNYSSSLEASLAPNQIPVEVFHNLISVFKQHLPTWHRYWKVRKKVLGYQQQFWYDTVAPLAKNPPAVSYPQAVDWISEGMHPMGEEYVRVLRQGCLEERWVDWSVNKGKTAGAFSGGAYDTNPYILMSYADDIYSLSTLAHELGHSLHSYYSRQNQPYVYARYSLFVAEVASNFNQAMTRAYLLETKTDLDFQVAIIDEAMNNFRRYFFIMPTLARFELEVHERVEQGKPTNADSLIALCADLFQEGFGSEIELDRERMGITWAQFGHLYANFYVYQYATGIAGAHALVSAVRGDDGGAATERYLDFLKAGGSQYPLEALKLAGVDLTQPGPVERAFEEMAELIDRLDTLLG